MRKRSSSRRWREIQSDSPPMAAKGDSTAHLLQVVKGSCRLFVRGANVRVHLRKYVGSAFVERSRGWRPNSFGGEASLRCDHRLEVVVAERSGVHERGTWMRGGRGCWRVARRVRVRRSQLRRKLICSRRLRVGRRDGGERGLLAMLHGARSEWWMRHAHEMVDRWGVAQLGAGRGKVTAQG